MLLTLLGLLDMYSPAPIPPTPHGGGDDVGFIEEGYAGKKRDEEKFLEERLRRIRQDDEEWLLFISQWIVENNN